MMSTMNGNVIIKALGGKINDGPESGARGRGKSAGSSLQRFGYIKFSANGGRLGAISPGTPMA